MLVILQIGEKMIGITASVSLADYVKIKIGPETGRGHNGYYNAFLSVADKVKTPEQAGDIQKSIDSVASAVRMDGKFSLRGESGQKYTIEHPSRLIDAVLKVIPYLGKGLDVEKLLEEIKLDLEKIR